MYKIILLAACVAALAGCASTIDSLAKDPATVSVHQVVLAPGWSVTTDYVRDNSGKSGAVSAGPNGAVAPNGAANTAAQSTAATTSASVSSGQ